MEKQPLISVIVPVYNVEQYLPRCLDSIINQTYTNLEILLIDDGATDNCGKICDEYAQKDNRIRVFHKENGGQASARNLGLDIAVGDLIMFVDSDDCLLLDMLSIMYSAMIRDNVDLVLCNYLKVSENLQLTTDDSVELAKEELGHYGIFETKDLVSFLCNGSRGCFTVPWAKLYSKNVLQDIRFPLDKKAHEDEFVSHKIYFNCSKASLIKDKLYYYVQREGSTMRLRNDRATLDYVEAMIERFSFAVNNNLDSIVEITCREAIGWLLLAHVKGKENKRRKRLLKKELLKAIKESRPYIAKFGSKNKPIIWGLKHCFGLLSILFSILANSRK